MVVEVAVVVMERSVTSAGDGSAGSADGMSTVLGVVEAEDDVVVADD